MATGFYPWDYHGNTSSPTPSPTPGPTPGATPYDPYAGASDPLFGQPSYQFPGFVDPTLFPNDPSSGGDTADTNVPPPGVFDAENPPISNMPQMTFVAPDTGPSDLPNNGPLYYNPPNKGFFGRAADTLSNIPGDLGNLAGNIGRGISDFFNQPGYYSPEYLQSIGYVGGFPGQNVFRGGAFQTPAGGIPLVGLGQGSHGYIPWDYFARMSRNRMIKGGDPSLGFGQLNTGPGQAIPRFVPGIGTGVYGRGFGMGIRGGGPTRYTSSFVNPAFYAPAPVPEASSQKPGGGAAAGGIGGGGPGGIA
jgi:hypothetical protein